LEGGGEMDSKKFSTMKIKWRQCYCTF